MVMLITFIYTYIYICKGGLSIIKLYGGLINAIKTLYPRARLGEGIH